MGGGRRSSSRCSAPSGSSRSSPSTTAAPAPRRSPAPPGSPWPRPTTCCAPAPTRAGCSGWTTAPTCWATGSTSSGAAGTAARGIAHARPALEWLRDALGGAVYLARYVDGEIVVAEIVDSARAPRIDLWVGVHDAAHATALGKCILGQLPAIDREDYLARHPLHDLTRAPWSTGGGCSCRDRRHRGRRRRVRDRGLLPGRHGDDGPRRRRGRRRHRAPAVGRPATRRTLLLGADRVSRALALGGRLSSPPSEIRPWRAAERGSTLRHGDPPPRSPTGRCGRSPRSTTRAAGRRASPSSTWACSGRSVVRDGHARVELLLTSGWCPFAARVLTDVDGRDRRAARRRLVRGRGRLGRGVDDRPARRPSAAASSASCPTRSPSATGTPTSRPIPQEDSHDR